LELAVVLPTYNERENIPLLMARLSIALRGVEWEAIFVDDNSPDGTADVIAAYAEESAKVRLLHRLGRRGLASACIEGMMATQARYVAVMDADMQHDETVLPQMLARLQKSSLDIVIGTRNAEGGCMGEFSKRRVLLSRVGQKISHAVCKCGISDPMSGFFMLRRSFLLEVVHDLQGEGFKILVDLLASSRRPVQIGEIGYTFRARKHGESKLDVVVGIEYLFLVVNKLLGGIIPVQLTLFLLVGACGLLTHLLFFTALTRWGHVRFEIAQTCAAFLAMAENFFLNNFITFRDRKFRGGRMVLGAARFMLACSFGAWANVVFARALVQSGVNQYVAGLAGIILGSVWNLSISSLFTWRTPKRKPGQVEEAFVNVLEAYR